MNKRHYEHTLPNIRGSLSNTYIFSMSCSFMFFIILSMNNPIGICFPDFIGSRPLDCLFAQGLGKENTGAERG